MLNPAGILRHLPPALLLVLLAAPAPGETYREEARQHSFLSFSKPAKETPAQQLDHAKELLKQGETRKAGRAFRALVMTWPGSREAPMAQWAYARVLDARGKNLEAFDEYQKLMDNYTGRFPDYEKALARQFEIATNLMYRKRGGFLFFGGFEAPERAIPFLENVIKNGPRSPFAAEAQYLVGEAYEKSFQYDMAVVSYIATLHRYPLSPFAEKAAFGRARSLNRISEQYPNDAEAMEEAWTGVMVFLQAYPDSRYAEEAQTMRDTLLHRKAAKAYEVARFYDRNTTRPEAAREAYEQFLRRYPMSSWTDEARARMMELDATIANSKDPSDEK